MCVRNQSPDILQQILSAQTKHHLLTEETGNSVTTDTCTQPFTVIDTTEKCMKTSDSDIKVLHLSTPRPPPWSYEPANQPLMECCVYWGRLRQTKAQRRFIHC